MKRLHVHVAVADLERSIRFYSTSNKAWVNDRSGIRWETFFTFGSATGYGEDAIPAGPASGSPRSACCA
ncbi:MAG TPA: VOC family protein [Rhizomicrobium sp.]|jgi:catechol 2,3-dioxygenase-like lactoylglutathione lyase family enzyme|nr:VOC family protein [Rhizomicrobium sp.]